MSAPNRGLVNLAEDDRVQLEALLVDFDEQWGKGLLHARFNQIPAGSSWLLLALTDVVKVDLERQWQRGHLANLESYLQQFPELGSPVDISADLIQTEYEVRRQFGAGNT